MAPFIRFFREIAEEAHRAPPRTTLMTNAVATVPYWLEAIPGGVAHWIPYFGRVRRRAKRPPSIRSSSCGCFEPSSDMALPVLLLWDIWPLHLVCPVLRVVAGPLSR